MLSSQRESPLKQEQGKKEAGQQWVADVIHQWNSWHIKTDEAIVILTSAAW